MDSTAGIGVLGRGATGLEGQAEKTPQEVPTTRREEEHYQRGEEARQSGGGLQ